MTIKFIGHACFLLTSSDGFRVLTDPYEPNAFGNTLNYRPITDEADVVLVSHDHADHNYVRGVPGIPEVCRDSCRVAGMEFHATKVPHDEAGGRKRGEVAVFTFELDGLRCCHLADVGTTLTAEQVQSIGPVDVLMIPVGGTYTVDAQGAWKLIEQLKPRLVIPMHYKTPQTQLPLAPLDAFTKGRPEVERLQGHTLEVTAEGLGDGLRVVILAPSN